MSDWFRSISEKSEDLLAPLRALESPVSTDEIRSQVLEQARGVSMWEQLRAPMAEMLMLGAVAMLVARVSIPSLSVDHVLPTTGLKSWVTPPIKVSGGPIHIQASSNVTLLPPSIATAMDGEIVGDLTSETEIALPFKAVSPLELPSVSPGSINSPAMDVASIRSAQIIDGEIMGDLTGDRYFATLETGAYFGDFRMLTEGVTAGLEHGSEVFALNVRAASGHRELKEIIQHHASESSVLSSGDNQQLSLMAGMHRDFGSISIRALAGPGVLRSTGISVDPMTGVSSAAATRLRFGVFSEVSAEYALSNSIGAGITGFAGWYGPVTGGFSLLVSYTP